MMRNSYFTYFFWNSRKWQFCKNFT